MHGGTRITSPANPRVKEIVALRRRRERDAAGLVVIEGFEELALALDAGVRPRALFFCPELMRDASELGLVERVAALGAETVECGRAVFEKAAYRESPDGFIAVAPRPRSALADLVLPAEPLILVCEGVEKPGNLGAMLRTADAAGAAAVIAADPVTDWGNPNVIRASKGTVFSVPVASGTAGEVAAWLHERGVRIVSLTPAADRLMSQTALTGAIAIGVGAEKHGLSREWLGRSDGRAKIPMFGRADSLNVATSAAIALYEAVRQRMSEG